jgi:IMP dehydrogenase/GMP reductase
MMSHCQLTLNCGTALLPPFLLQMLPSISNAIAKAAAAKAAAAAKEAAEAAPNEGGSGGKRDKKKDREVAVVIHRELPSRHARSAAAEQIRKTGSVAAAASKGKEDSAVAVEQEEDEPTGWL